jgi:chromosome segregation ATPase
MAEQSQQTRSTFWQGFGRFLGSLIRLLLFIIVIALVTGAIYFAIPYVYRYTILPVQNNRVVIEQLRRSQTELRDEFSGQLAEQRERIAQLEAELVAERETHSELETRLTRQEEATSTQADLNEQIGTQGQAITGLEEGVAQLRTSLDDIEQIVASPENQLTALQRQVLILQMNQAILKTQLHLVENNPGQAQDTLEDVGRALARLEAIAPASKQAEMEEFAAQLDEVSTAIEEQPFIALQELEILWQLAQNLSD